VWPRRRDRRRGKSAHAITWPRRLFLFSPLGTTSVPTLSLSSPSASCRLAFAALTTHSLKLAARRSRACPDRSPRPRQQNQPALVLRTQKRSRGRLRSRLGPATLVAHSFASLPARRLQSHGDPRASRPSAASKVNVLTAASFSLFPPQHSWHETMLARYLCPLQYISCVSPSGAPRAQAMTRSAASQTGVRATSPEKTYIL
jgi:hypothetical protein